jgi:rRNA processing protein Gar1
LRRLDKIILISNQRHLITKVQSAQIKSLKIGQAVVTKDLVKIGRIFDIFGPVAHPYISIKPNQDITEPINLLNEVVYCFEEKKTVRGKHSKRSGGK